MSVNKVILVGHAGRDAEVRYIDNGAAVATFSMATSETYIAKTGEKVTTTEWHNITVWRGLAEFAGKYIKKGQQLYVEGRIRTRSYDDKEGIKRYVTEILADTINLLGRKEQSDSAGADNGSTQTQYQQPATATSETFAAQEPADDLPF
jgi:single-strand DNA-binding protein